MGLLARIAGVIGSFFQVGGPTGPGLNDNAGALEARNAANSAYAIMRGADPVANNDLVTLEYLTAHALTSSIPTRVPFVAGTAPFAGATFIVIGGSSVDMSQYPATLGGLNRSVYFVVDFNVAVITDTATIQLWDATDGVAITGASDSTSAVTPITRFMSAALTVGTANGDIRTDVIAQYQVQAAVTAGSTTNDALCYDAYLLFVYT